MPTDPELQFRHCDEKLTDRLRAVTGKFPEKLGLAGKVMYSKNCGSNTRLSYEITIECRMLDFKWIRVESSKQLDSMIAGKDWFFEYMVREFWCSIASRYLKA